MKLSELLKQAQVVGKFSGEDIDVTSISADSREVSAGSLFVAMPSARTDTLQFLPQVWEAGCRAIVVPAAPGARALGPHLTGTLGAGPGEFSVIELPSTGSAFFFALGRICRTLTCDPSRDLRITAVTGTNGKTTTAWMLRDVLTALGRRCAYLGTLGLALPGQEVRELSNTTPFPVELWNLLAEIRDAGCTDLVMEASSHALVQRRLSGVRFDAGVFTNLTQDHLDFHGSMEEYAAAKELLFTEYAAASDKPFVGALRGPWKETAPCAQVEFSFEASQVLVDRIIGHIGPTGPIEVGVGGLFNVENIESAVGGALALGYSAEQVAEALPAITPVPGRFEAVRNDQGIGILVDYAHTPDALEKVLNSARGLNPKRLIAVFGCGGDRDRTKRPKMAASTSALADLTVVTSDNPRTEEPQAILDEIVAGILPGRESVAILDRGEAIAYAVQTAQPGDIVVIAGKGHENYQIIGHTKHPMDDRELARRGLGVFS